MANQHFFKPLLSGFHSHLTIPIAFFMKNIEGRNEQKTAELRSDASKIAWEVKIDGQRLTDGWKEFAVAHDLRIGDIVVFRQERDVAFHVTMLGPSCCEIQYVSRLDDQNNFGKIQRTKRVKKNPRRETESSSLDPSCFVANITPSTLLYDRMHLPRSFVRENGLDTRCGEIVLMNEKGISWTSDLRGRKSSIAYIKRGWRSFCHANGLRAGSVFTFKLIQKGRTLVLRLSPKESEEEHKCSEANEVESLSTEPESDEESSQDEKNPQECSKRSSTSQNRFVTVTLTRYNVSLSRLNLPIAFTRVNGIKKAKKMSFLDKHGVKWSTNLRFEKEHKRMRLVGGWKEFCDANRVKIGESIMLELIWEADKSFVLKFCSKILKSENMTEPAKEQKRSSIMLDCVSKLQPSLSPSVSKKHTLSMRDWSLLPEELLHLIDNNLEDEDYCFDVVHARSVCSSWRSIFPFPSSLIRPRYSLPTFKNCPHESKDLCTLEKIPLFLFRVKTPAMSSPFVYYLGDLGRDNSEDHMELPSPLQCSVRMKIPGSDPTLMNMLDCQILSLGHQYRMIGWNPESWVSAYRGVAVLPLNKEGGGEFVVLLNYTNKLLVLRSAEMRWMVLKQISDASCKDVVTFRGRFYAVFLSGETFVIDPYSLEATRLMPLQPRSSIIYLVPSGNDELFLVEATMPDDEVIEFSRLTCRVSRLDEEAREWVAVSDFGDRVLFIGEQGNVACSAKELPDGCGVSGNSMLFTNWPGEVIYFYKYGLSTGYAEEDLNFWRFSREYRVTILNKSPPVVAFRVER